MLYVVCFINAITVSVYLIGIRHLWHKHIRRGVSALLVQLYRAMRRPRSVERADDSKNFHALFIEYNNNLLT